MKFNLKLVFTILLMSYSLGFSQDPLNNYQWTSIDENSYRQVITGTDPFGNASNLLEVTPDGNWRGFEFYNVAVDPNKTYRFSFWTKATSVTPGYTFTGKVSMGGGLLSNNSETANDFYLQSGWAMPGSNQWYLYVGYIKGTSDTNTYTGVVHTPSGFLTNLGTNGFSFNGNANTLTFGSSSNSADPTNKIFYYDFRIMEVVNGDNSVQDLLNPPGSQDITAPTTPTLTFNTTTSSSVNLLWNGASDNVGVTGYKIFQNGSLLVTLGNVSNFQVTGLLPGTSYSYSVNAIDATGNESDPSNTIQITTQAAPNTAGNNKLDLSGLSTEQSTTYYNSISSLAVDGDKTGSGSSVVTHTLEEEDSWWRIDLGAVYDLTRIDIYNRINCCNERLDGTKVYVGVTDSYSPMDYTQVGTTLTGSLSVQQLDFSASGRYILVSQHDIVGPRILSLAEVEAYGTLSSVNNGGTTGTGGTSPWVLGQNNNISFNSGNVGIGISDPGTDKLAVNGNIRAKEVRVEIANWPDYVFEKDYKLPTLYEVENHIKKYGHLMNIPSATNIEENGVDVGQMNKLLLEKIEELTLYIIQQEKRIKILESKAKMSQ